MESWHASAHNAAMAATVLIVDDHAGFRRSARRILEEDGYVVVGEAQDGREGVAAAIRLKPDIVLLDVYLPDGSGFDFAREIGALPDGPAVVLTSSHDREDFGASLPDTAACGFVPKGDLSGPAVAALVA
jgi:DNA-binding NarL/FixJ family response regulator